MPSFAQMTESGRTECKEKQHYKGYGNTMLQQLAVEWLLPRCIECTAGLVAIKLSVGLSVRPSVKRAICDKTKEICDHILIPHERSFILVFTALHAMQTRSSDENSVRPSVCLSVCQSVCHTRVL